MNKRSIIIITGSIYILFLTYYGINSWFFPSKPVAVISFIFTQMLAFKIAFWMYKNSPDKTNTKYGVIGKPVGILGVIGLLPSLFWIPVIGFSAQISLLFQGDSEIITTVRSIDTDGDGCPNRIGFEGVSIFFKTDICIDAATLDLYRLGDQVELIVKESMLGTRLYSFKKYG